MYKKKKKIEKYPNSYIVENIIKLMNIEKYLVNIQNNC